MSMSEAAIAQRAVLEASQSGVLLLRNNSGALTDETGRLIRFGLGNDSETFNREFKSGDWIGIAPMLITPEHVGKTLGVFINVETKAEGWHMIPSDKRAAAQARFNDLVRGYGALAGFYSKPGDLVRILKGEAL